MTTHTRNRSTDQVVLNKTARTERAAEAFAWLRLLNGDRDPIALAVGVVLLDHFNPMEGGQARPGCALMAAKLGVAESTVIRAIRRMHKRGRLKVAWGCPGRGHPSRYWMVVKPAPAQVLDAGKPARKKPAPEENKTCASAREPLSEPLGDREALHASPIPVERENALTRDDSLSIGGAAGAAPDRSEESKRAADAAQDPARRSKQDRIADAPVFDLLAVEPPAAEAESEAAGAERGCGGNAVASLAEQKQWRELRKIWDRGWSSDDAPRSIAIARRAFARACAVTEGGGEDIVAAAKAWVAAADAPRFLPPLADWLNARGWEKPPPAKAKRVRAGGRAERSRYDKPSIASRLLAIAEREA